MSNEQITDMVVLSVAQMQHLNALFAQNPEATHVNVYEKEDKDGNYCATTAKIGFTETSKKGKATVRYNEEVRLFTDVE